MKPIIECIDINKTYTVKGFFNIKTIPVLRGINFNVLKNEVFSIIGLNGAGKTTLLSTIIGSVKPSCGEVRFSIDNHREKIGYMPEIINFPQNLSPLDILKSLRFIYPEITKKKIFEILDAVGLKNFENSPLKTFSKGMFQRFNLAQSIIHTPEILILDEPFSGLDPLGRELFFNIIKELNNRGVTILFSSHILTDVEKISDRVMILHGGCIVKIFEREDISEPLNNLFVKYIKEEKGIRELIDS